MRLVKVRLYEIQQASPWMRVYSRGKSPRPSGKEGAYLGLLKGNHGEVMTAAAYWLEMQLGTAPPDYFVVMSAANAVP